MTLLVTLLVALLVAGVARVIWRSQGGEENQSPCTGSMVGAQERATTTRSASRRTFWPFEVSSTAIPYSWCDRCVLETDRDQSGSIGLCLRRFYNVEMARSRRSEFRESHARTT